MSNKDDKQKNITTVDDKGSASEARRKAVKNILAGSGIAATAATSGEWVKPAIDAVLTPAHAQTSTTVQVLQGSASISTPKTGASRVATKSVLDLFMSSANATASAVKSLDGACLTMTLDFGANTVSVEIEYHDESSDTVTGTISGTSISGSNGMVMFSGTANQAAGTATGTIGNGMTSYSFSVSNSVSSCIPSPPRDTTTGMPTTTGYPTTGYPTTGYPTTGYPTTGYATTTGFPTTTGLPTTTTSGMPTTMPPTTPPV